MKQLTVAQGKINLLEVPPPEAGDGRLLVANTFSCISSGTELASLQSTGKPLLQRAIENPDLVRRVLKQAITNGLGQTRRQVESVLATGNAIGYSSAGRVIAVGPGVTGFRPGDRVACAGSGYANHAEVIAVPVNLCVRVPEGVADKTAAVATIGSIALQGVRRAEPTLGESFVAQGLGLLGQITVQLLLANGCRVIAVDPDASRLELAGTWGPVLMVPTNEPDLPGRIRQLTDGYGADGVLITAAGASDEIISQAFQCCRRRGRVVLVGDVGLHLQREDIYKKELDFRVSCSYGPGRYDPTYEEEGLDYPLPYVRWTENRNLSAFLELVATGKVKIEPMIGGIFPLERAPEAYQSLRTGSPRPLLVLLEYPEAGTWLRSAPSRTISLTPPTAKASHGDRVGIGLIGAGGFAKSFHLPNLVRLKDRARLVGIADTNGLTAASVAKQFQAESATTDFAELLARPEIDAVVICTWHDVHSAQVLQALAAGKHVLVEKPLALTASDLVALETYVEAHREGMPIVMTGFNRRFSPCVQAIKRIVTERGGPFTYQYRMNAGFVPADHWTQGPHGGGRNLGEACHIYDLFVYLTNHPARDIQVARIHPTSGPFTGRDNFAVTLTFDDGSLATLHYLASGAGNLPKERMEFHGSGVSGIMDDYLSLKVYGLPDRDITLKNRDKGHLAELEAFLKAIRVGKAWPIPWQQQIEATRIALEVEKV